MRFDQVPQEIYREVSDVRSDASGPELTITRSDGLYVVCWPEHSVNLSDAVVAGPLTEDQVPRARAVLGSLLDIQFSVRQLERNRLDLASELEVLGNAVLAITAELDTGLVLRRIVDLARNVAGARYAALGVPGPDGDLETFITSGLSDAEEVKIGSYPKGRGLLGLLLREPKTIRVADLSLHPDSVGFPPNHPPMRSFLGVPIISRGEVLGNLYLTEKRHGPEFTAVDERRVEVLARHAAVAIENAKLYTQLEDQQARLRDILDQMPEAVVVAESDPERITLANTQASQLLGWQIEPPVDLEPWLARNPRLNELGEPMAIDDVPLVRALRFGEVHEQAELRLERPDGTRRALLTNSSPLRDSTGRVNAAIVVFQDITEIKDAEQLKDDFLSLVSHELRTPLTTIQGGAMMLERDGDKLPPDLRHEMLADISNESRRLAIIIENLVQLANVRAGRLALSTEPVAVARLIERSISATRQVAADREFVIDVETDLLADADGDRIDQVLRNLLHNAAKYSPEDSAIEVSARGIGKMVEFAVRDHGTGIEESELPNLFERFRRTRSAQQSSKPGMGLGLYLCRHVIEAHGGEIHIELPDDGGTRVVFTVPALAADM